LAFGHNPKAIPTSCIEQGGETERYIYRNWNAPRLKTNLSIPIHNEA
jgi:hypothetical protein